VVRVKLPVRNGAPSAGGSATSSTPRETTPENRKR